MLEKIKQFSPWWLKIWLKIVFSRLPISYGVWRDLGIFRHGKMLDPSYAQNVFFAHWNTAKNHVTATNFTILELGPGDSVSTSVLGFVVGAEKTYLVDAGKYADNDIVKYSLLLQQFKEMWSDPDFPDVPSMLKATNAVYLTDGLASLRTIPGASVDFVFSQAVLEHVTLSEFEATMRELFRIQTPGGVASHAVDLKDHLQYGLNSLRFSDRIWEASWFARRSGFYTNRLRASQIMQILTEIGYEILDHKLNKWDHLPISRSVLVPPYNTMSDDELCVREINLFIRKPLSAYNESSVF